MPQNINPSELVVFSEIAGKLSKIVQLGQTTFVEIIGQDGKLAYLDAAFFPGGLDWAKARIGKPIHIRQIGRALQPGKP